MYNLVTSPVGAASARESVGGQVAAAEEARHGAQRVEPGGGG